MATFTESIEIAASPNSVWGTLVDIGSIAEWNPGVVASRCTSGGEVDLGSKRICELGGRNYLDEEVVEFVHQRRIAFRINDTNLPFAHAVIRFTITPAGDHSYVEVSPEYRLKYGALGKLMDALMVRRMYRAGMVDMLRGLKRYLEAPVAEAGAAAT